MRWCSVVLAVVLVVSFLPQSAFAANVYYVGSSSSSLVSGENYPSYSLTDRAKDLVDFGAYGKNDPDRSGKVSGRVLSQMNYQNVSGNKAKSFYADEGVDYLEELNLNVDEKLFYDYRLEGEYFLRKTDNARIEPRRDVRLKQMNTKITNDYNLLEFGDFYADFSQFVLGSSLEGAHVEVGELPHQKYQAVVARSTRADTAGEKYQRNVGGGKFDFTYFEDSEIFSNFRTGVQAVTSQDDSSTAAESSAVQDLENSVASVDGEIMMRKWFGLSYELARSQYVEDDDSRTNTDENYGTAFRLQPSFRMLDDKVNFRYLYNYIQPQFYSDLGSASPDKEQHQFSLDLRVHERATLQLVENLYWDHLTDSEQTKRTTYDEKYITLNVQPLESRESLSVRPYFNYQQRNADDEADTAEANTSTLGIGVNDTICGFSVGPFYEYRAFDSKYDSTQSDYFHRFGLSASRDMQVFSRRLYFSMSVSNDLRNSKQDPNKDVNAGITFNGQYDLLEQLALKFGYNIQNSNNAGPDSDYINTLTFSELDYQLFKKRATHLILRGEYNRYDHEDGAQDYNEELLIAKCVSNF